MKKRHACDACAGKKKKMCQTDEKKRRGRFFRPLVFFCPFQIKILKESALAGVALLNIVSFLFFLRFFVFLSSRSEYSFVALLVGRARARVYIYLETRDLDAFHSRDETRKRERRKENDVHERRRSRRKKGRGRKKDRIVFSEQRSFE
jgi:hypothetical protein